MIPLITAAGSELCISKRVKYFKTLLYLSPSCYSVPFKINSSIGYYPHAETIELCSCRTTHSLTVHDSLCSASTLFKIDVDWNTRWRTDCKLVSSAEIIRPTWYGIGRWCEIEIAHSLFFLDELKDRVGCYRRYPNEQIVHKKVESPTFKFSDSITIHDGCCYHRNTKDENSRALCLNNTKYNQ